uniref:50S ribosomal protein L35 n=2 Tax=Gracilariopsis TaxID=2781 RepID=A0A1C9CEP5_9FLOR|nr:ribosomal protein L35 [Gracilariopsis lemaneiformis]YP_009294618.1 ribosomal protein L35 [Gracilariopsis chorda]AJO68459.1 ribosomal protein L35 [Gracilariopsis lemaneiformis]AML79898.1 ribosomal protein L35 [Gracilariopsis lemaneiformis]AOM66878.1 ribosomal protein L35 [Gracilariopsis chorda]UAD88861.1 ribosomal protein L35 [Gracilariopsis chorda]
MYKLKTSKAISKRFKITSKYKILRQMACRSHLLQKKSSKRKQKLRKVLNVKSVDILNFRCKIPYIY